MDNKLSGFLIVVAALGQHVAQGIHGARIIGGAAEQVAKITVAEHLGKLSLAMRSAVEQHEKGEYGTTFSGDVSPEIARQSRTVVVYSGDNVKEYNVQQPGGNNER